MCRAGPLLRLLPRSALSWAVGEGKPASAHGWVGCLWAGNGNRPLIRHETEVLRRRPGNLVEPVGEKFARDRQGPRKRTKLRHVQAPRSITRRAHGASSSGSKGWRLVTEPHRQY